MYAFPPSVASYCGGRAHPKKHYALYIELLTYPSETTLITFYKVINVVSFRMPTMPKKYKYPLSAFLRKNQNYSNHGSILFYVLVELKNDTKNIKYRSVCR
jgi:hypothetical protein